MQKHHASMSGDYPDVTFNDSILPVSTDSTELLRLIRILNRLHEGFTVENLIVAVDVIDTSIVSLGEGFKANFGLESGDCVSRLLEMTPEELTGMIAPEHGTGVPMLGCCD